MRAQWARAPGPPPSKGPHQSSIHGAVERFQSTQKISPQFENTMLVYKKNENQNFSWRDFWKSEFFDFLGKFRFVTSTFLPLKVL